MNVISHRTASAPLTSTQPVKPTRNACGRLPRAPGRRARSMLAMTAVVMTAALAGCASGGGAPGEPGAGERMAAGEQGRVVERTSPRWLRSGRDGESGRIVLSYTLGADGFITSIRTDESPSAWFGAQAIATLQDLMHLAPPQ